MKKYLLSILLSLLIVTSFTTSVFAIDFNIDIPSVAVESNIVIVDGELNKDTNYYEIETEGNGKVAAIPYYLKNELTDEQQLELEKAYQSIKDAEKLSDLNQDLINKAHNVGANEDELTIADLFYLGEYETKDGFKNLTISTETIKDFVCLMKFVDGKWIIVENVKVSEGYISFDFDDSGVYAIVVATGYSYEGDFWHTLLHICSIIGLLISVVDSIYFNKKENNKGIGASIIIGLIICIIAAIFDTCNIGLYVLIVEAIYCIVFYVLIRKKIEENNDEE